MATHEIVARDWLSDAERQYRDELHQVQEDAGECIQPCCARDLRDQVYTAKMKQRLQRLDPLAAASQRAHGLATDAAVEATGENERTEEDADELAHIRKQRHTALQHTQQQREQAAALGYGALSDVDFDQAMVCLRDLPAVVLHVAEPGIGGTADEALARLALQFPGTRFLRTPSQHAGPLLRRLRVPRGSWLVAAASGVPVGVMTTDEEAPREAGASSTPAAQEGDESSDFGDDDSRCGVLDLEERVKVWASALKVLRQTPFKPEGVISEADELAADVESEWNTPCPECGRTYFHVHKNSVRSGLNSHIDD